MKRTTLILDDRLFKEVKKFAVETDSSFRDVAESAFRLYLKTKRNGVPGTTPLVMKQSLRGILKGIPFVTDKELKEIQEDIFFGRKR